MCEDYDAADWWKHGYTEESEELEETKELTDTEKKIALNEERSRRHWQSWKTYGSRVYLYQYKQANIKIRNLRREQVRGV